MIFLLDGVYEGLRGEALTPAHAHSCILRPVICHRSLLIVHKVVHYSILEVVFEVFVVLEVLFGAE